MILLKQLYNSKFTCVYTYIHAAQPIRRCDAIRCDAHCKKKLQSTKDIKTQFFQNEPINPVCCFLLPFSFLFFSFCFCFTFIKIRASKELIMKKIKTNGWSLWPGLRWYHLFVVDWRDETPRYPANREMGGDNEKKIKPRRHREHQNWKRAKKKKRNKKRGKGEWMDRRPEHTVTHTLTHTHTYTYTFDVCGAWSVPARHMLCGVAKSVCVACVGVGAERERLL